MALYQDSGSTLAQRSAEAMKIVDRLSRVNAELNKKEQEFISNIEDRLENNEDVSPKQLFWLRDLAEKYYA